jgi:hypothetical protein
MSPDDLLWSRYLDVVEQLKSADRVSLEEYAILKFSPEARRLLMEQTLGDASGVTETTVQEVLEEAKSAIEAPLIALVEETKEAAAARVAQAERDEEYARQVAAEELRAAQRERDEALRDKAAALAELQKVTESQKESARNKAFRQARVLSLALIGLPLYILAIAAAVAYVTRSLGWKGLPDAVVAWGAVAFVVFFAIELGDYLFGLHLNVRLLVRRIEVQIARRLEARYLRKPGPRG